MPHRLLEHAIQISERVEREAAEAPERDRWIREMEAIWFPHRDGS